MIICSGGTTFTVQTGNIHLDRGVILKERTTIPLFTLRGTMQKHMQNGQVNVYLPKLNGNLLREVARRPIYIHGAINSNQMADGWRTFMRGSFRKTTMVRMDSQA